MDSGVLSGSSACQPTLGGPCGAGIPDRTEGPALPSPFEVSPLLLSAARTVLTFALLWTCTAGTLAAQDPPPPVARHGVLDLRGWDFEHQGALELQGEWALFWGRLLEPGERAAPDRFPELPGSWNGLEVAGTPLAAEGYGTYRLRILFEPAQRVIALRIPPVRTAYQLFIGEEVVARGGVVGTHRDTSQPGGRERMVYLPAMDPEVDLTLQVSNFHFREGGPVHSFEIGLPHQVAAGRPGRMARLFFFFGSFLILGIYHIAIFVQRRDQTAPLTFAFLCFLLAAYILIVENELWTGLGAFLGWQEELRLEYVLFLFIGPTIWLFLQRLYPRELSRGLGLALLGSAGAFAVVVLVVPTIVSSQYVLRVAQIIGLVVTAYLLVAMSVAVYRRRVGAVWFLVGFLAFSATAVFDGMARQFLLDPPRLLAWGFLAFVLAQSVMIARVLSETFHEAERLSTRLLSLDRLKDEFLANTSHELRTPLHGIIGVADSLLAEAAGPLSQSVRGHLQLIVSSGHRLATLVDDILDLARLRNRDLRLELEAVDLRSCADLVVGLCSPLARQRDLELRNDVPENLPPAHADERRLQQILHNIVGNAIKFTDRGEVAVSAHAGPDGRLTVSVRDTGVGIPSDRLESIFESFEQVDGGNTRNQPGTGLGLAITKKLVELHHGELSCESRPDHGSTFSFTLPLAPRQSEISTVLQLHRIEPTLPEELLEPTSRTAGEDSDEETGLARSRILVVDDDPVNLHVLVNYLAARNIEVITARSGQQALRRMREGFQPDLVILDVMMPQMSGFELCRRLRMRYRANELPVIFLTAKTQAEDVVAGLEAGANDYLTKPVSREELLARIDTHLEVKRLTAEKLLLEQAAFRDSLTGVANRRRFEIAIEQHLDAPERNGGPFALLFLDLDDFKQINDSYGHAAGDVVLSRVAECMTNALRANDQVARLGGDEFGALLVGADRRAAEASRSRVLELLGTPVEIGGVLVSARASIGIACVPEDGETLDALLEAADRAMYEVKRAEKRAEQSAEKQPTSEPAPLPE